MKNKLSASLHSYGQYEPWEKRGKGIPKLLHHTTTITARLGIEFGYVLKILNGKGKRIDYKIEHPPFKNSQGVTAPPFKGQVYIKNNDYLFFLGDSIWEPVADKVGIWRLLTKVEGKILGDLSLSLVNDESDEVEYG